MFKNQNWESFAGIVVGVFILSFVILGIVNIITFSLDNSNSYLASTKAASITSNAYKIFNTLDTTGLNSGEEFYIYKNSSTNSFSFLSGASNSSYMYVNDAMEYISDVNTYDWTIYVLKGIVYKKDSFLSELDTIVEITTSVY